jgi:hypothetical protein
LTKELKKLFNDLKGAPDDDRIDPSTLLYYLFNSGVYKRNPFFFTYLYYKIKDLRKFNEDEFV